MKRMASVSYTAEKTTNQTVYRGKALLAGETLRLFDGDEISIPTGDDSDDGSILMVVVTSKLRVDIWRRLMEESRDPRTGLGGRNAFLIWCAQNVSHTISSGRFLFLMEIDFYEHLREIRGEEAMNEAMVMAYGTVKEVTKAADRIFQLDDSTLVGVVDVAPQSAQRLFEAIGDLVINTVIKDSHHITVSISYMDCEDISDVSKSEAQELIDGMRIALEEEKKQSMCNCLVQWNGSWRGDQL